MSRLAPLRALAAHLRTGAPLPAEDRDRLAEGLDHFLSGEVEGLDDAMGLKPGPGQRAARTDAILDERARMLREVAAEFFADLTPTVQARALHERWARYEATG